MNGEPQPTTVSADRPLFLAIAGNIGVGKSTLTRHLAMRYSRNGLYDYFYSQT